MTSYTKKSYIRCMLLLVLFCLIVNIFLFYSNNLEWDFYKIQQLRQKLQQEQQKGQQEPENKEEQHIEQQQKQLRPKLQQEQENEEEQQIEQKQQLKPKLQQEKQTEQQEQQEETQLQHIIQPTVNFYDPQESSRSDPVILYMTTTVSEPTNKQDHQQIDDIKQYREQRFNSYSQRNNLNEDLGLGDWGKAASLNESLKKVAKEVQKKEMFNKVLSDLISLDRRLPDFRNPLCLNVNYPPNLPQASVIMVFCDEAPSVVWRTVHSVVNRSPPGLLAEVVLVDDASSRADLKASLKSHVQEFFPDGIVKIYRSEERLGLIRARNLGATKAEGEVLVFLDAHCEVTIQWLEPLLNRIKEEPTAVVCPMIDLLSTGSLAYHLNGDGAMGAFDWSLTFKWMKIPKKVVSRKKYVEPVSSPAMAGGLFGMRKDFFFHLGQYDEGMNIWGAENIEMSIRVWTCGGRIEILPCSRVAHLYRATFPYPTDGKDLSINPKRVAEVWLDDYKDIFYLYVPHLKRRREGDIRSREDLRKKLRCKPFKWYLDAVFPQLFVPYENVLEYGAICNPASSYCWDSVGAHTSYGSFSIYLKPFRKSVNQLFSLDMEGRIRKEDRCLAVSNQWLQMEDCGDAKQVVVLYSKGDGRMRIRKRGGLLGNFNVDPVNPRATMCVEAFYRSQNNDFKLIFSEHCHSSNSFQYWKFEQIL